MTKFGDDVALSLGGTLPPPFVNGLPAIYKRLCAGGAPVFAVVTISTNYVKHFPDGDQPDEPVLYLARIEPASGDDEADLLKMMDRLQSERNGAPSLASSQGELTGPEPDASADPAEPDGQDEDADSDPWAGEGPAGEPAGAS